MDNMNSIGGMNSINNMKMDNSIENMKFMINMKNMGNMKNIDSADNMKNMGNMKNMNTMENMNIMGNMNSMGNMKNSDNNMNCNNNREKLLCKIMEIRFFALDMALYLDTHPEDKRALEMHNDMTQKYMILVKQYEDEYGPLTMATEMNSWAWIDNPWPWERRDNR